MKSFANIIINNRITVLISVLIVTMILGYQMIKVNMNADFATYLKQDDPLVKQYNKLGDKFGGKSTAMVLIETDDIFSYMNLKLIQDLTESYKLLDEVSYVTSLTNVLDFKKIDEGLEVGKLFLEGEIPKDRDKLVKLKNYVMSKEMYEGNLISYDGTSALIAIRLAPEVNEYSAAEKIKKTTEEITSSTKQIYFGGMPFLIFSMTEGILESLNILLPIMISLLFLILYLGFRTIGGILIPLSIVMISVIWTIGLMVVFGFSLDMLSGIMPVILLAMGSADGIHLLKRYYEIRSLGKMPKTAIKEALSEIGLPMILTTITTIVGFLSLLVSNFSVISQFGLVTSLGIFLALIASFTFIPAILSLSKGKGVKVKRYTSRRVISFMEKLAGLIFNNKKSVLILAVVIVITSVLAIPKIIKDVDWTLCLKRGSKPWQAEMLMRDKFRGSLPIQISIQGDMKEPSTLKTMRYLERYLETLKLVSKSQSLAKVLSEMNDIMNDRFIVPETEDGVANLCFLIEGDEIMEQLVHGDYKEALIQAKFGTMQTQEMTHFSDSTEKFIENLPENFVVVDKRNIPSDASGVMNEIITKRITENIFMDLKKRDIEIAKDKIENILISAISRNEIRKEIITALYDKLTTFLLSEESDIEFTSTNQTNSFIQPVTENIRYSSDISAENIADILASVINGYSKDDIIFLSESIENIMLEIIFQNRVDESLNEIIKILPSPASDISTYLIREIKGDLWALNENLITISKNDYNKFLAGFDIEIVKEHQIVVSHTGLVPILNKMEEELTPTQVGSVLFALFFVTLILSFIFHSFMVGIISVIPIILTVLVNFAIIGYLNIGLDSFIAMIASITIGLGTDYSIHFTSRFRHELIISNNILMALKRTFSTTGIAIIINTFSVGLGFAVLMFGPCQHVRMFGRLTGITMLTSTIFTLSVLPALTLVFKPKYLKKQELK